MPEGRPLRGVTSGGPEGADGGEERNFESESEIYISRSGRLDHTKNQQHAHNVEDQRFRTHSLPYSFEVN